MSSEQQKRVTGYRRPFWNTQPQYHYPNYISTVARSPREPLIMLPHTLSEITGPVFQQSELGANDWDLYHQHAGDPLGERIYVTGRVIDENGRPVRKTLVEIWQANASGRYGHKRDQHDAPLDPNFTGCGRTLTDDDGRYRFLTIKPGAYCWRNHYNAWRPAHIHFSLFGPAFATRIVTQMYFPGDQLLDFDPMFQGIANERARNRLISVFDWENVVPEYALAYKFDIVLRGPDETPMETRP